MGFGEELRDQLADIDHYTQNSIVYLEEFRDYIKDRAAIEKEYAAKLDLLVKNYSRKVRKSGHSFFGAGTTFKDDTEPKKGDLDVDLSKTTASAALTAIFLQTEIAARARDSFSNKLLSSISDPLKLEYKRKDEARQKHMSFADSLNVALMASKAEVDKTKQAYRAACNQLEAAYMRYNKAQQADQQEKLKAEWNDALVFKKDRQNEYLLAIQMFNAHKQNHIYVDMTTLMNNMQDLNEHTIMRARDIFTEYIALENNLLADIRTCDDNAQGLVSQINGPADTQQFITQTKKPWSEPADEQFSPFTDKDEAVLDSESGKTPMLNTLLKLRRDVEKNDAEITAKLKEIDGIRNLLDSFQKGINKGDEFKSQQELIEAERHRSVIQAYKVKNIAQIELIEASMGDVGTKEHNFKSTSSGSCAWCKSGLSMFNRGFQCQECKITVHAKCSTKIPPCGHVIVPPVTLTNLAQPSSGGNLVRSKTTRAPKGNSVRKPDTGKAIYATVLYDFAKANEGELDARQGDKIRVLDADDGNGWMTGELNGVTGVIPTNYVELAKDTINPSLLSTSPNTSMASSHSSLSMPSAPVYVRAIYDYTAQVDLELTIREGDIIEVTNKNVGEGWWEGKLDGKIGQFPENYVEPA